MASAREIHLEPLEEVAALSLEDRGQQRRHAEDFRGFGQSHHVIDDRLGVVTAKTSHLERLMVYQDQATVVRREQGTQARVRIALIAHIGSPRPAELLAAIAVRTGATIWNGDPVEKRIYGLNLSQKKIHARRGIAVPVAVFIAAAEEGSFSAAGRKLQRAQSLVSHAVANLEAQLNVKLFDRSRKYPRLTLPGQALILEARAVIGGMEGFTARARTMAEGLEPELSVVVDVVYPMASLTNAVGFFRRTYQNTPLRLYVEALGGVIELCSTVVAALQLGFLPTVPDEIATKPPLKFLSSLSSRPTIRSLRHAAQCPRRRSNNTSNSY